MTTEYTPSSIIIRSYQPSDLLECQEIFTEVHRAYGHPKLYIDSVIKSDMADIEKNYLQVPNGHWWVAVSTDDNRVLGHVAVLPLSLGSPPYYHEFPEKEREQVCELLRMAVSSKAQRAGIGTKLVSTLIDFVREKGYHQIHLSTLTSMNKACGFYERSGFTKGRIEKFEYDFSQVGSIEDMHEHMKNQKPEAIFEVGEMIPEEELRLMKMPILESKCFFVQHYSLLL